MVGFAQPRFGRSSRRASVARTCRGERLGGSLAGLALALAAFLGAAPVQAADQTSPSHRHRAGTFAAIAAARLPSAAASPRYVGSIVSLGAGIEVAPFGRTDSLRSVLPGFFWIEAGRSDFLDLDADGASFFLDEDDDGDGLLDVHETGTGTYVSAQNTGTSAVRADSDGDGFSDGAEVGAGTDPTDPGSHPGAAAVPFLSAGARLLLAIALALAGLRVLPLESSRSTGRRST